METEILLQQSGHLPAGREAVQCLYGEERGLEVGGAEAEDQLGESLPGHPEAESHPAGLTQGLLGDGRLRQGLERLCKGQRVEGDQAGQHVPPLCS